MDDTHDPNTPDPRQPTTELEHVTQEMYKKNLELAERNKTLSLLRKMDEIVLSSLTDTAEFARQIIHTLVTEGDSKIAALYLLDQKSNTLTSLAYAQTDELLRAESEMNKKIFPEAIPLTESENLIVIARSEKSMKKTDKLYDILLTHFSDSDAAKIQEILGISHLLIYPLMVRGEAQGVMVIGTDEKDELLATYRQDLLDRAAVTIGIAIDNALLYKNIQEANEQLQQLDKLKDEFVSLASHELRTPMTAIKSYVWMLMENKMVQDPKGNEYLHHAYEATDRLITLVNDMLNVSRIESGRMVVTKEPLALPELIQETIAEVKPVADKQHIEITVSGTENLPAVSADKNKIKEVLINLIGNSLKFTPDGGHIQITTQSSQNAVTVQVTDNGHGISPEDITKLFTKFGMIEKNYTEGAAKNGTGLGLYICKSIIELHGGTISVTSEGEGHGTTFSFTLPVAS